MIKEYFNGDEIIEDDDHGAHDKNKRVFTINSVKKDKVNYKANALLIKNTLTQQEI